VKKIPIVISCTSLLVCIVLFLWKKNNRPTGFHKVEQFTKIGEETSELFEVYVITNPPDNLKQFKEEVYNSIIGLQKATNTRSMRG